MIMIMIMIQQYIPHDYDYDYDISPSIISMMIFHDISEMHLGSSSHQPTRAKAPSPDMASVPGISRPFRCRPWNPWAPPSPRHVAWEFGGANALVAVGPGSRPNVGSEVEVESTFLQLSSGKRLFKDEARCHDFKYDHQKTDCLLGITDHYTRIRHIRQKHSYTG